MLVRKAIVAGPIYLGLKADPALVEVEPNITSIEPEQVFAVEGVTSGMRGSAAETGLVLHNLGVPTRLVGKVGDDQMGEVVIEDLRAVNPDLAQGVVIDPSVKTGAIIHFGSPIEDRIIPGANNTFYASDMPRADLQEADLLHFTNPAAMRSVYRGEGGELVSILQRARREGLTTSLDFHLPPIGSSSKLVDWTLVLENCLRDVDVLFMGGEDLTQIFGSEFDVLTPALLDELSGKIISSGVELLLIRLGSSGAFLRTAPAPAWKKAGRALAGFSETWHDQELWAPAIEGCASGGAELFAAGFLSSLLRSEEPDNALLKVCAAQVSEESDWEDIQAQLDADWETLPQDLSGEGWRKEGHHDLWRKG